ncbi:MAG: LysE family translocator [Cyanobacteria bacterium CRU_2_1]|nr:LysE family translocator [Cyanobacteria bacterium CRU_2_1]
MTNLTLFLITTAIFTVSPGPDTIYVMARSLGQGRRAGIISVLGIGIGLLVHTVASAVGLSAVLMTSALAYNLVKYVGAGYLIYLGVQIFLSREKHETFKLMDRSSLTKVFSQGILSSTLNPKLAIFFLAFLPQFVNPSHGRVALQFITLGSLVTVIGMLWLILVALLTSSIGKWLRRHSRFVQLQQRLTGCILISLGIRLAIPEQRG